LELAMKKRYVGVNDQGRRVGEDHPNAKLTDHEVVLVLETYKRLRSYAKVARVFEIGKSTVAGYVKRRRRDQVAVKWRAL
jgi:hypothetical protein